MHVYEYPGGLIVATSQRKARALLKHLDDPDGINGPVGVHRVPDGRVLVLEDSSGEEVRMLARTYVRQFAKPEIVSDRN